MPAGGNGADAANVDEFYIRRINWLITLGRYDLIDEIADDCERRRAPTHAAADQWPAPQAAMSCAAHATQDALPDLQSLADHHTVNESGARHNLTRSASAAPRPPYAVHHGRNSQSEPRIAAGLPPKPVATGTRLAVARLRRALRPARAQLPGL